MRKGVRASVPPNFPSVYKCNCKQKQYVLGTKRNIIPVLYT